MNQMKKLKLLALSTITIILMLGLSGCTSESKNQSPISIDVKTVTSNFGSYNLSVPVVEVTSLVDNITINDVIGNNGNCRMNSIRQKEFPKKLSYGQKATAGFLANCNLIKVDVVTSEGSYGLELE